jgi:hypothetical protein
MLWWFIDVNWYPRLFFMQKCMRSHQRNSTLTMLPIGLLLGNDSVYTFPRKPTRKTIGRLLLDNGAVNTPKIIWDSRSRCFPWGPPLGYITRSSKGAVSGQELRVRFEEEFIRESCCRELGRVLEMAVEDDWEEMARKKSGGAKKNSCVIWSDSEIFTNPLPGYD